MPGVVSNPSPLPSACTIHSDAEYEVMVGRKTSRSGSNVRGVIFRRKASSSILTIRAAVDAGLDAAPSTLRAERAPAGGVLHAWRGLHLPSSPASIIAQRVGEILSTWTKVLPQFTLLENQSYISSQTVGESLRPQHTVVGMTHTPKTVTNNTL